MMKNPYLVAVMAGLAAAALQATLIAPSPVSFLLFSLSSLPLFVTGFGFGPLPAVLAGVMGTVVLTALLGWQAGLMFAYSAAAAPVILTWTALKHRPAAGVVPMEGEVSDGNVQWYPEGRLVLWAAGISVAVMFASFLAGGGDLAAFKESITRIAREIGKMLVQERALPGGQLDAFVNVIVVLVPPVNAALWHVATMVCLWLAAAIVTKSDIGLRPWAPFSALRYPRESLWALGGTIAFIVLDAVWRTGPAYVGAWGIVTLAGALVLGALCSAYVILGLAVVHALTSGLNAQFFFLSGLYLALVALPGVLFVPLMALAVADMILDLRGRTKGQAPPGTTGTT